MHPIVGFVNQVFVHISVSIGGFDSGELHESTKRCSRNNGVFGTVLTESPLGRKEYTEEPQYAHWWHFGCHFGRNASVKLYGSVVLSITSISGIKGNDVVQIPYIFETENDTIEFVFENTKLYIGSFNIYNKAQYMFR